MNKIQSTINPDGKGSASICYLFLRLAAWAARPTKINIYFRCGPKPNLLRFGLAECPLGHSAPRGAARCGICFRHSREEINMVSGPIFWYNETKR